MEIQLQELIEQIKKEGVEAAESQAASIIESAKAEAEKIVAEAKEQAEKSVLEAKETNARFEKASEDAIRQACRNLLISFRESIVNELGAILNDGVKAAYSSDDLSSLIVKVVEAFAKDNEADNLSVLLNSKDLERFEGTLLAALKQNMLGGVTLKPNDSFDGGFRIAAKDGTAYYDYSGEAVVEMLSSYLNPRITELLKEAEGL